MALDNILLLNKINREEQPIALFCSPRSLPSSYIKTVHGLVIVQYEVCLRSASTKTSYLLSCPHGNGSPSALDLVQRQLKSAIEPSSPQPGLTASALLCEIPLWEGWTPAANKWNLPHDPVTAKSQQAQTPQITHAREAVASAKAYMDQASLASVC